MSRTASPDNSTKKARKNSNNSAGKRQYLPAEERRKRILEAAREVFSQTGLKGARTRELAQAAGINQATLFEHFKSKEELFLASVIAPLEEFMEGARERAQHYAAAESTDNMVDQVQASMNQRLQRMNTIFPLLVQALFSDQELGKKLYNEKILPLFDTQADVIKDFVDPAMSPRLVQVASFGMFFAVVMDQHMTGNEIDIDSVSRQLTNLIISGSAPSRDKPK